MLTTEWGEPVVEFIDDHLREVLGLDGRRLSARGRRQGRGGHRQLTGAPQ
ncbi:hypothetical protein [Streptomyces sp. NTH33]|nr:hypothetical protein [Streptomyces sp. NTH33]